MSMPPGYGNHELAFAATQKDGGMDRRRQALELIQTTALLLAEAEIEQQRFSKR